MDIRQLIKTKAALVKYHLSHLKPGYLFRTRIPRLCPVVGLDENVIIVYGRYEVYNENNEDNPHEIIIEEDYVTINIVNCFAVKKLTEEHYIQFLLREERQ